MKGAGMEREGEGTPRGDSLQDKGRGVLKDQRATTFFCSRLLDAIQ
jgi:hypothetical protein